MHSGCYVTELENITIDNIKNHSDELLTVTFESERPSVQKIFVIRDDDHVKIVVKYMKLRPSNMTTNRFFISYKMGMCTEQVLGKKELCRIPGKVASYLKLPILSNIQQNDSGVG